MDKDKSINNPDSLTARRKRIKRMKICIVALVLALLILPVILCIILFFKMNSLQKQVDILMIAHYDVTYDEMSRKNDDSVVYAAVTDDYGTLESAEDNPGKEDGRAKEDISASAGDHETEDTKDGTALTDTESTDGAADKLPGVKTGNKQRFLNKKVYLTFDDGPSNYTDDILDILAEYNVKATFFVIGKTDDFSKEMYKRIVEEGHTLGMHSYSHKYDYIYNSLEDFDKDFTKLRDLLYDTTGYLPTLYRFPGGSCNNVSNVDISSLIKYLNDKSVTYFDWNVDNGDATGKNLTQKTLYDNVIDGVEKHTTSVVLMHDTDRKVNTVKVLKRVLRTLTEEGASVLPISEDTTPVQQVKFDSFGQK